MKLIAIFCLCLTAFGFSDGIELPPALMEKMEEAKERVKKPQHMFDRPKLTGALGGLGLGGDVLSYQTQIQVELEAFGSNCRKLGQECGALHVPCCKKDPDTQEPIDLICEYQEGDDVSKRYVAGRCASNPNPSPLLEYQFGLSGPGFK